MTVLLEAAGNHMAGAVATGLTVFLLLMVILAIPGPERPGQRSGQPQLARPSKENRKIEFPSF